MSFELYIDSFHDLCRITILKNGHLYAFRLIDFNKPPRLGAIFSGRITQISKAHQGLFIELNANEIGFLKSSLTSYTQGQWIACEIIKESNSEKKVLLKERLDYKPSSKFEQLSSPPLPLDQIASLFSPHTIYSKKTEYEDEFIEACLEKIFLPQGNLLIEEGRTLTSIDVNISDFSTTLFEFNLACCKSIADQIRRRNIGGLIVIDFPRMKNPDQQKAIFQKLKQFLKEDYVRVDVLGFTKAGLFEITRYSDRQSLKTILGELWHKI